MVHRIGIDWGWARKSLVESERFSRVKEGLVKKAVSKAAGEALAIAKAKSSPRAVVIKKRILEITPSIIKVEGGVELHSRKLSSFLKRSEYLYVFAVTIGKRVEEAATRHMDKGDALRGYLLDRIGSFACESLAESAEKQIRKACAANNMSASMRLSPGYCDWPVEEQFKLAKIADLSTIGVILNKNCMMIPKKSITAIVGAGPKGLFKKPGSQCGICDKKDCGYRRVN